MAIKMRGILKGLTYISHIFEAGEEQQDLQIGPPTDVKHVAHIGWDGLTTTPPSWMSQYESEGDSAGVAKVDQENPPKIRELKLSTTEKRPSTEYDSSLESPLKRRSSKTKTTRRQMTTGARLESHRRSPPSDKPTKTKKASPSNDSSAHENDPISSGKGTRRKKSKALSISSVPKTTTSNKVKGTSQLEEDFIGVQAEATAAAC